MAVGRVPLFNFIIHQDWFRQICCALVVFYAADVLGAELIPLQTAKANIMPVMSSGPFSAGSPAAASPVLRGLSVNRQDPLRISFLADAGYFPTISDDETSRQIKYFLSFLAVPEKDLWVNLSPVEPDRIINPTLAKTEAGRDMLKEDYALKQLAATLTFPDHETGRMFWENVYSKVERKFGQVDLPIDAFSRVWVVPEKAVVYEQETSALIAETQLKVLLDEDYLSAKEAESKGSSSDGAGRARAVYLAIAREIIVPELEREVNEGQYFVRLRQMFNALVLSIWFKRKLQEHIINKVYAGKKRITGIQIEDNFVAQKVYEEYMRALKKGVYDVIREEYDPQSGDLIPRRYYSGGFSFHDAAQKVEFKAMPIQLDERDTLLKRAGRKLFSFTMSLSPRGMSRKAFLTLVMAAGFFMGTGLSGGNLAFAGDNLTPEIASQQQDQRLVSRGSLISAADQKYFSFMQSYLSVKDFKDIQGEPDPYTGRHYHFDWRYIERNWNSLFSRPVMGWSQQAVLIVAQHKLGISEDGILGPRTRSAMDQVMAKGLLSGKEPAAINYPTGGEKEKLSPEESQGQERSPREIKSGIAGDWTGKWTPIRFEVKPSIYQNMAVTTVGPSEPEGSLKSLKQEARFSDFARDWGDGWIGWVNVPKAPHLLAQGTVIPYGHINAAPKDIAVEISSINNGYNIRAATSLVPETISLAAPLTGIISGLDVNKQMYKKGEVICRLENILARQQKEGLSKALSLEKNALEGLRRLFTVQAASSVEINQAEGRIRQLEQELVQVDHKLLNEELRAPRDMYIKEFLRMNGMAVNAGEKVLDGLCQDIFSLTLELPSAQYYFGRVRSLKVNGEEVDRLIKADWSLDAQHHQAQATFKVAFDQKSIQSKEIFVEASIEPPLVASDEKIREVEGAAETLAVTRAAQEFSMEAPEAGGARFFVKEGDRVRAGQLLAVQDGGSVLEYKRAVAAYNNLMVRLQQSDGSAGARYISREEIVSLQEQAAGLKAKINMLKQQARRMKILAPLSGYVTGVADARAAMFREGETLVTIRKNEVRVGNIDQMAGAVLLPLTLDLAVNDPLVLQTPDGNRLIGRVIRINRKPYDPNLELGDVQAVELMAVDKDGVLGENQPVMVIAPTEDERGYLRGLLEKELREEPRSQLEIPAEQKVAENRTKEPKYRTKPAVIKAGTAEVRTSSQAEAMNALTMTEVAQRVAGNNLLHGESAMDLIKAQAAEGLVTPSSFTLKGGVFLNDGKLSFSGGLGVMFQGVAGMVSTGSAIGAALPAAFSLSGQIMDLISGGNEQARSLAADMTGIARHHMEDAVIRQINRAEELFIHIARAQQEIDELNALSQDLKKAEGILEAREAGAYSVTTDKDALLRKTADVTSQLAGWQHRHKQLLIELNHLAGYSLDKTYRVSVPTEGSFTGVSEEEYHALRQKLLSETTQNYRLREAMASLTAMERTVALQKLSILPSVDLHSLYMSGGGEANPMYDLISGTAMRTSALKMGENGSLQYSLSVVDTGRDDRDRIVEAEMQKAKINLARVRSELEAEFIKAVESQRALSRQIADAVSGYESAKKSWQMKMSRTDLFRADQVIEERWQMTKAAERVADLKSQYFQAESQLARLQLRDHGFSAVKKAADEGKVANSSEENIVTKPVKRISAKASWMGDYKLIGDELNGKELPSKKQESNVLSAGHVIYHLSGNMIETWARMVGKQNGQHTYPDITEKVLTRDANIKHRMQAWDYLLEQTPSARQLPYIVEKVVLNSPYQDVVQKALLYMANRGGCDIRFFINVIEQSLQVKNVELTGRALQILSDMIEDPDVFKGLSELNYASGLGAAYTRINSDTARRVFLTFMAWAPNDSVAKTRLLQGGYWSTEQLAQIYNSLEQEGDERAQELRGLIYDEMLRREALHNVDEVYSKGPFRQETGAVFFEDDIYVAYMYDQLKVMTRRFLTISPQWRDMEKYISHKLYARAQEAVNGLVKSGNARWTGFSRPVVILPELSKMAPAGMEYFTGLGLEGQKNYIQSTKNQSELARIFLLPSTCRNLAFDRLMTTTSGRVFLLQAYLSSDDDNLCRLVEAGNWIDVLRTDLALFDDPATNGVLRQAMEKMYARTQEAWAQSIRLKTYSFPELQVEAKEGTDKQTRYQSEVAATELALGVVNEVANHGIRMYAGASVYNPQEQALVSEIRYRLQANNDPEGVGIYLSQLKLHKTGKAGRLLSNLEITRDRILAMDVRNDSGLPRMPFWNRLLAWGAGVSAVFLGYKTQRRKKLLRTAQTEELINDLHREFSVDLAGEGERNSERSWWTGWFRGLKNGKRKPLVVCVPDKGLPETARASLQRWQEIVQMWRLQATVMDEQTLTSGLNNILNNAFTVLIKTAYTPELMGKSSGCAGGAVLNEQYQVTLTYFNLLAVDTLNTMEGMLDKRGYLTDEQGRVLLRDVKLLEHMMRYAASYLRILEHRGIIDKVMSYKFSDTHWAERFKIYPFMRWCLLYTYQWHVSQRKLYDELPALLREGESLINGLYGDQGRQEEVVASSKSVLNDAVVRASNLASPLREKVGYKHKMRSFISRVRLLALPFTLGVISVMGLFGMSLFGTGISLIGLCGMLVGMLVFWIPHINIMMMSWSQTMDVLINVLAGNLERKLHVPEGARPDGEVGTARDETVRMAIIDGERRLSEEMDMRNESSIDMIVISAENPADTERLKAYVSSRKGRLFRDDVPVEVISTGLKGSGNAYFEAMRFVRDCFADEDYLLKNPSLRGRAWHDARVMFVFNSDNVTEETVLDWAVTNGYRAAVNSANDPVPYKAGGQAKRHIIVYSRDAYFGPMFRMPDTDINLLGDWVSVEDLKDLGLMVMDIVQEGVSIQEVIEKLDLEQLQKMEEGKVIRNKLLRYLSENYDLGKRDLRQFPALTGIMVLGERSVSLLSQVLDGLLDDPQLWSRLKYLQMTADVLNNLLKPQEEIISDYLNKRVSFSDIKEKYGTGDEDELRSLLLPFYRMMARARGDQSGPLRVHSMLPHYNSAEVIHLKKEERMAQILDVFSQAKWQDAGPKNSSRQDNSQLNGSHGGLDFSAAGGKVSWQEAQGYGFESKLQPDKPREDVMRYLNLFRGFDFKILEIKPEEPSGIFFAR